MKRQPSFTAARFGKSHVRPRQRQPSSSQLSSVEFVDAGFGYNNPCEILIAEAERQFPDRARHMRVLSIGTGLGDVVTIRDKRLSIFKALKQMATSSNQVAARMDDKHGDDGKYYRLNVDKGLEDVTLSDWDKASTISAHTHNYLQANRRRIERFVKSFVEDASPAEEVRDETLEVVG